MDTELYLRFRALVISGKTVRYIRQRLGKALERFDDEVLICKMLDILKETHGDESTSAVSCS